jgi:hypothetical protein
MNEQPPVHHALKALPGIKNVEVDAWRRNSAFSWHIEEIELTLEDGTVIAFLGNYDGNNDIAQISTYITSPDGERKSY